MAVVWIVVAVVVVVGIVIALFGWDRYRGGQKCREAPVTPNRPTRCLSILTRGRRLRVWYDQQSGHRSIARAPTGRLP